MVVAIERAKADVFVAGTSGRAVTMGVVWRNDGQSLMLYDA